MSNTLSLTEERELIQKFQKHHDPVVLETMFSAYHELVDSWIHECVNVSTLPHYSYEDLVQEGMLGLVIAISQFDLTKNNKFRTVARRLVKAQITQFIQSSKVTQTISIDDNVVEQISEENIAKTVQQAFDLSLLKLSLKRILTAREYYVIYHHYLAPEIKSIKELGQILNVSQQKIYLIQKSGLNKIRQLWPNSESEITELLTEAGISQYEMEHLDQLCFVPLEPETIYEYAKLKSSLPQKVYEAFYLTYIYEFSLSYDEIAELLGLSLERLNEFYQFIAQQPNSNYFDYNTIFIDGTISVIETDHKNIDSAWRWLQRNAPQSIKGNQKIR